MVLRQAARAFRGQVLSSPLARYPIQRLQRLGLPLPERVYRHLGFRGEFEVEVPEGGRFRMFSHGHKVENTVFWAGLTGYEGSSLNPWIKAARSSRVIIDAGANTGLYSLVAAAVAPPGAEVHAFEPVPRIAELFRKNLALNPGFSVTLHQQAIGAASGTAQLNDPGGENCYSASLDAGFLSAWQTSYPVEVVSTDDFCAKRGFDSVDLMKIDVEGFEHVVLDGMQQTLERYRPLVILEFLQRSKPRLREQITELVARGWGYYRLTARGLEQSKQILPPTDGKNVMLGWPDRVASLGLLA